ncbi:MAG: hypothetical protein II018_05435 [Firmicutes bacterium]|nr:hypothetical protein [Bacillota bacterium]
MGLFDKLVSAVQEGDLNKAMDSLKDLAEEATEGAAKLGQAIKDNIPEDVLQSVRDAAGEDREAPEAPAKPCANAQAEASGSGLPWGDTMPAEENQYNFSGTYEEYFTEVFNSEFPDYTVEKESIRDGRALCFTFKKEGRTALIVEVMSQKSNAQKLRNMARREGTPYLRYYYDHHGWWNTRSYVTERTREALG